MADRLPGLKWNYYPPDVLPAWVAEMDFGLAPPIVEALVDAAERGDTGYHYPAAMEAAAVAATGFWSDRLGWAVEPDWVFHVPDVIEGVRRAVAFLTRPGSAAIIPTPAYFPFFSMVERAGREMALVPSRVDEQGRWRLDMDGIDGAFAAGAGSVVLCNPWNPVGRSLSSPEVEEVVGIAAAHGGRVIADEIHAALTYPDSHHVAAASVDPGTVVTVTAASKAWNVPGLKAAQVVLTHDEDRSFWSDYFTAEKMGVSTFGLIAAAAAYSGGVPWLDGVISRLDANRTLLAKLVADLLPAATHSSPEATYLGWIDLGAYGWEQPAAHLLEHARVALGEGSQFGTGGAGHVRLNFATAEENLVEIVERIAAAT